MEFRIRATSIFVIFGLCMLVPSVMIHEAGHAVACIWQGFDMIEVNFLASYVICSNPDSHLVHIMGGAAGSAVMLSFLCIKAIRNHLPIWLGFAVAALTQFLNMLLEGFLNPIYREFDLENLVLAFGVATVILLVFVLRSRMTKSYIVRIGRR